MIEAVVVMQEDQASIRNRLQQYSNDFQMYGKYNVEKLDEVRDSVNELHQRQTEIETLFSRSDMAFSLQSVRGQMLDAMSFNFDLQLYVTLTEEEHVNQHGLLETASKDLLRGTATLGQGRLPQELFPDQRLKALLKEVQAMVKKQYPDYILAADHIFHYRDMKLVTFPVDRAGHSLIVSFPVFIKDYQKPSLAMYEIESVPMPIPGKNTKVNSYSQIKIHKPYIAAGEDYYIQLCMTELIICKYIKYTYYYCEELFVVKHKNKHSCASAIFYDLGPKMGHQELPF